jgi:hypothetical protein
VVYCQQTDKFKSAEGLTFQDGIFYEDLLFKLGALLKEPVFEEEVDKVTVGVDSSTSAN